MEKYRVEKAMFGSELRYLVTEEGIPIPEICLWLDWESIRSPLTGRTYAFCVCSYLRYLSKFKLDYKNQVTRKVIEEYLKFLIFGEVTLINLRSNVTYNSLKKQLTVIKSFYRWLESERYIDNNPMETLLPVTKYSANYNKTKLLYGSIYDFKLEDSFLSRILPKPPIAYNKWYKKTEIDLLSKHFKYLRDKVIFLISIETGMRIGEICGLKIGHFNFMEQTISVLRENNIFNESYAKTKDRTNYLSSRLCDLLSQYITDSRANTTYYDFIFVNQKGLHSGNPIKPSNYLAILKRTAERAGMNPRIIRTHNGRSTRAQNLIEIMRNNPDSGVTETFILEELGWSSARSMESYVKAFSIDEKKNILVSLEDNFGITEERWYEFNDKKADF